MKLLQSSADRSRMNIIDSDYEKRKNVKSKFWFFFNLVPQLSIIWHCYLGYHLTWLLVCGLSFNFKIVFIFCRDKIRCCWSLASLAVPAWWTLTKCQLIWAKIPTGQHLKSLIRQGIFLLMSIHHRKRLIITLVSFGHRWRAPFSQHLISSF